MVFTEDARAHGATAFPTLVRLDGSGRETGRLVGYRPKAEVLAWMASP
jgi:thioredoxin-related protein